MSFVSFVERYADFFAEIELCISFRLLESPYDAIHKTYAFDSLIVKLRT